VLLNMSGGALHVLPRAVQCIDMPAAGGERTGLGLAVSGRGLQVGPQEIQPQARASAQE